jgi:lysophospholipase L1-like esterase
MVLGGARQRKVKILIIGDSISLGYTPYVQEILAEQAIVLHNPGNAQHTGTGLEKIEEWIGDGEWDIIHFNWGLWDLAYRHPDAKVYGNRDKINGTITYSVAEYAANLDSIVKVLKSSTTATLVFATTTYVPKQEAGRYKRDPVRYNKAAKKVMTRNKVLVNDIYHQSRSIHRQYGKGEDDVHFTKEGYQKLANVVSNYLEFQIQ